MTTDQLSLLAGTLLSLAFSYIPGVSPWYDALSPNYKRLVMLGALLLASIGLFAYSCAGRTDAFTCDIVGAWTALELFVLAAIANQTAHRLTPK